MEILVTILVGLLGACATIWGAHIQRGRSKEEERAAEAKFAVAHTPMSAQTVQGVQRSNQVHVSLMFPGSSAFHDYRALKQHTFGYVEVLVDGERVGSGPGDRGFKIDFTTTVGMHDLVFMWDDDSEGRHSEVLGYLRPSTDTYRASMEVVFESPGACGIRLGFSARGSSGRANEDGGFYVRQFEPRSAGYVPLSRKTTWTMLTGGIAVVVLSALILWAALSIRGASNRNSKRFNLSHHHRLLTCDRIV